MRDAIIARDLHDTAPGSTTPGPLCDVDHVTGWTSGGSTDAPNLTLLAKRFNNAKYRSDWQLTRHRDGTRTWTVPRTGYRIRQPRPPHLTRRTRPRPENGPSP